MADRLDGEDSGLAARFFEGDRSALARVITLIDDRSPRGDALYRQVYGRGQDAYRVGVTGPIGVGKSTLVAKLATRLRADGKRVGIVAIDPTSPFTQGALLGDRIRMGELAMDDGVFMRSMATRGNVGGLSRSTRMVVDVLEAFGKDVVLVETVGVGQAEMDILDSVDTSVVVLMPDMGDSVQIMKAGLLEIADVFVLNKADRPGVEEMDNDLNFFLDTCKPERFKTWRPPVVRTRADQGVGVDACVRCLQDHRTFLEQKNLLEDRKRKRLHKQIKEMLQESLQDHVWERFGLDERIRSSAEAVARRASNPLHETEALVALVAGGLPGGAEVTHD